MVKLVGFVLSPSEHPIYLLKNLVGRFSPLYYIVRTQAKIADVVTNKLVMSTSKSCAYISITIKTDWLMMSYTVTKLADVS